MFNISCTESVYIFLGSEMIVEWVMVGVLICLLGFALWRDIVSRRIPNWLTGVGLVAGLALNLTIPNGIGPGSALSGALAGFVILMPLYRKR